MKSISVQELKESMSNAEGVAYLDVRTPKEFNNENIEGFENIPLDTIDENLEKIKSYKSVVVLCASGQRSKRACKKLHDIKVEIQNVDGGIQSWKDAAFATKKAAKPTMSIFRQVQIVAGSGVVLGVLLSQIQNPNFIYLSLFFGAGLVFSGITNTCAMGVLLAKMPWNK